MVKIPERPEAHIARGSPAARGSSAVEDAGAGWEMIGEAARKIGRIAGKWQSRRDHDLLVEAQNRYTGAMTDFTVKAERERTGDRARGFTKDFAGQSDSTRNEVAKWLKENGGSGEAERAFGNWATGRKTAGGAGAAQFEHGQMLAHSRDLFTRRIQGITDQLERNPLAFGDAAGQMEEAFTLAVGQGIFRPEEAKARLHDAREKLGLTAFDNLYAMDRGRAMKSMDALGLTPARQGRAKKRFQADARADAAFARQERAERKAEIGAALPDADYLAAQTGDVSELRGYAAELRRLGDIKSAERLERRAGLYESNHAAILESRAMPLPELAARMGELEKEITALQSRGAHGATRPQGAGETALSPDEAGAGVKGSEHVARKLHRLNGEMEVRRNNYADRTQKLLHDPAAVALSNDQGLAGQLAASMDTAGGLAPPGTPAAESLVTKLMAKQEAIGQGVPGFRPQPMTRAQADDLNKQWFGELDAGKQAAALELLRQRYGRHLPAVIAQAKLPPALVAVAPIMDSLSPADTARMVMAAQAKDGDLPRSDDQVKQAIADSKFLRAAQSISRVMFRSAEARDFAAKTIRAWTNYARLGGDIAELEDKFVILNDGNLRVLAPKGMDAAGLESGFAAVTRDLGDSVPDGKTAAEREEALRLRAMYANGNWMYDGKGGFALVDAATGLAVDRKSRDEILRAAGSADPVDPYGYDAE